jgi:rare lipoprotein A
MARSATCASNIRSDKRRIHVSTAELVLTVRVVDQLPFDSAHRPAGICPGFTAIPIASRRVIALADRYTGRHIHRPRHARPGLWVTARRSTLNQRFGPFTAAAALTITGALFGAAGVALQMSSGPSHAPVGLASQYNPSDYLFPDVQAQQQVPTAPASAPASAPPVAAVVSSGNCRASYYEDGTGTASGETFNPNAMTAAYNNVPFNTLVRVTNAANGKSVIVRVNDRGGSTASRCVLLSRGAFASIANLGTGVIAVTYEVLAPDG